MTPTHRILLAALLFLTAAPSPPARAGATADEPKVTRTLYVSPAADASDASPGTDPSRPLKTIQRAIDLAGDADARIVLAPGAYRTCASVGPGRNTLVFEAREPGKSVVTGSDPASPRREADGLYSVPWSQKWGPGPNGFNHGIPVVERRYENVWLGGKRLTQRVADPADKDDVGTPACAAAAGPVAPAALRPGEFTVDEAGGRIFFRPFAGGAAPSDEDVEVAVRGGLQGATHAADGRSLFEVRDHSHLVFRGIRFTHAANYYRFHAALQFTGSDRPPDSGPADVLIEDCDFSDNNGIGLQLDGYRDVKVRNCDFNDNGERGAGSGNGADFDITDCRFDGNSWRFSTLAGHDAAGWKTIGPDDWGPHGFRFLRCRFKDNPHHCSGIWFDWNARDVTIDRCLFENNGCAVNLEWGPGPAVIRDCVFRDNDQAILGFASHDVTVEGSYLLTDRGLIFSLIQDNGRIGPATYGGKSSVRDWKIRRCVLIATGKADLWHCAWENNPKPHPKEEWAATVDSDDNRWFKADARAFPDFRRGIYAWDGMSVDMTFPEWQKQPKPDGSLRDAHSVWGAADVSDVPDPTDPKARLDTSRHRRQGERPQ